MRTSHLLPLAAASLLLLAGCATATPSTDSDSDAPEIAAADLTVADTDLGQIVVDGSGRTVYFFDNDVAGSGQSTCTGQCATMWPAVHPAGAEPVVDGITAEVATIIGTDGRPQLTIDGRPVYTFASDEAPGEVNGQGVNDLWYVVGADGAELKDPTQSEDPSY